jgi:Tfp pilus assembly protein PilV
MLSLRAEQRGDTIVEVLIVAAIISMVLVASYATTNRNVQLMQANGERIQAQRLVEAQIEALRANNGISVSGRCFKGSAESATCDDFTSTGSGAVYTLSVEGPAGMPPVVAGVYTISAAWSGLGDDSSGSNVEMVYRLK